jgi:hypothetical protein
MRVVNPEKFFKFLDANLSPIAIPPKNPEIASELIPWWILGILLGSTGIFGFILIIAKQKQKSSI